jgi:hypothetical protein
MLANLGTRIPYWRLEPHKIMPPTLAYREEQCIDMLIRVLHAFMVSYIIKET